MERLLETLVWIQNLPVETWIVPALFSPLFSGTFLWILQGLGGMIFFAHPSGRPGPFSRSSFLKQRKGLIAAAIAFAFGLIIFFAAKPIPNNAGMPELEIKFVEDSAAQTGTDEKKKSLIIFVHGWKGDDQTFGLFPDLLSTDLTMKGFGYALFRYTVHMRDRNLSIIEISNVLLKQLMRADVDRNFTQIYIVAHSLGGVIVREMAILNKLSARKLPFRGVVSLASPFNGSPFATIADVLGISENLTRDVGPNSTFLSILNSHWEVHDQSELWAYCFGSTIDKIVNSKSASFGCGSHYEYTSDFGHTELVKPAGHNDVRYSSVMKTILQDGKI